MAETAWQPIETAPKDGTHVLVWSKSWGPTQAFFISEDDEDYYEGWVAYHADQEIAPTHWMPLPAAPIPHTPA